MITLATDCLLFQLANGESVPFSIGELEQQTIRRKGDHCFASSFFTS